MGGIEMGKKVNIGWMNIGIMWKSEKREGEKKIKKNFTKYIFYLIFLYKFGSFIFPLFFFRFSFFVLSVKKKK